ncbi:hypothetical protein MKX01_014177 [Papaver californicum]|nr:hypothetical protein MKX01_014177 [Papaver californicum]
MYYNNKIGFYGLIKQTDVDRKSQKVAKSQYKFSYGVQTKIEKTLALIDALAYEELIEVIKCTKMKRDSIAIWREHDAPPKETKKDVVADVNGGDDNIAAPNN